MSVSITKTNLARVGVELLDRGTLRLRCMDCGHQWAISQGADRRRPNHFRQCSVCHPEMRRGLVLRRPRLFNNPFSLLKPSRRAA
jgi:hypothetical protein